MARCAEARWLSPQSLPCRLRGVLRRASITANDECQPDEILVELIDKCRERCRIAGSHGFEQSGNRHSGNSSGDGRHTLLMNGCPVSFPSAIDCCALTIDSGVFLRRRRNQPSQVGWRERQSGQPRPAPLIRWGSTAPFAPPTERGLCRSSTSFEIPIPIDLELRTYCQNVVS